MSNSVTITGNISTDVELSYTPGGNAVAKFNVAVNSGSGDNQKLEGYFPVTAWRQLALHIAESLAKGDRVVVTGRLQQDRWENESGDKRSKIFIVANEVSPSLVFATASVRKAEQTPDS